MLMKIAQDPRLAEPKHVSLLPLSWGTLYQITKLNNDTFDRLVRGGHIRPDVEQHEIVQPKDERRPCAILLYYRKP